MHPTAQPTNQPTNESTNTTPPHDSFFPQHQGQVVSSVDEAEHAYVNVLNKVRKKSSCYMCINLAVGSCALCGGFVGTSCRWHSHMYPCGGWCS